MACPGVGPCSPWDLDLCCLVTGSFPDPCLEGGQQVPQEIIDSSVLAASQFLWAATGRQFGCCQVTIRPTQNPRNCPCDGDVLDTYGYPWVPKLLEDGSWTNVSCFCGQDPCGCPEDPCELVLPYPICSIDEVKVDGVVVGPELYRVFDFKKLIRKPGSVVAFNDWTDTSVNNPGVEVTKGDLQISGMVATMLPPPLFEVPKIAASGIVLWSLNDQELNEPFDPCMEVQFNNPGDTATVNAAIVQNVSGPATYNPMTGLITYTGEASPPRVGPSLVKICWLQSVKATDITFDQSVFIWSFSWSDTKTGPNCWPKCQNLSLDDDQPGTMSVTLTYGRPVPELVRLAAGEFACQLIKACVGAPCQLPQRLTSLSRQGVSMSFLDPMDFIDKGKTGIYLVDMAIKIYNPNMLMQRARVYSPDTIGKWTVETFGPGDATGPNCT